MIYIVISLLCFASLVVFLLLSSADKQVIFQKSHTFEHAGVSRTYVQYIPKQQPKKLVIAIHELGGNGRRFAYYTGLQNVVDDSTAIVFPDAVKPTHKGERPGWNASFCCGSGWVNKQDDVGYIVALAKSFGETYNISADNTYLIGFSNGSMLTLRTISEHPESFGGASISSGSMGANNNNLQPKAPVALLMMHGDKDTTVPYGGGVGSSDANFTWLSFEQSRNRWTTVNKSSDPKPSTSLFGGAQDYAGIKLLRTIETQNAGHTWIDWRIANIWHRKPFMSREAVRFLDNL